MSRLKRRRGALLIRPDEINVLEYLRHNQRGEGIEWKGDTPEVMLIDQLLARGVLVGDIRVGFKLTELGEVLWNRE